MQKVPETVDVGQAVSMLRKLADALEQEEVKIACIQADISTVNSVVLTTAYTFTVVNAELPEGIDYE